MIDQTHITVKREPDGGFVWLRVAMQRGSIRASRVTYPTHAAAVTTTIERDASTAALKGSTEDEQFFDKKAASH